MNLSSKVSFALVGLAVAACSSDPLASPDGVVFLALSEPPSAHMEALFEGSVILDEAGCIRLDSAEGSTVVWPYGSTLQRSGTEWHVREVGGAEIGRIGGAFRFGGGHVPSLHDAIPLPQQDRERAQANCPGDFWIVGDID